GPARRGGGTCSGVCPASCLRPPASDSPGAAPPIPLTLSWENPIHGLPPVLGEESIPSERASHVLPVTDRLVLDSLVERLGHPHRLVERTLHLDLEPPFDRRVDEVGRDEEDQDRRRQGQREERG